VEVFAAHAGAVSSWSFRYDAPCIPWTQDLVNDPRLAHLLSHDDAALYARIVSPELDDDDVRGVFEGGRQRAEVRRVEMLVFFQAHGPVLEENHPLRRALGLTPLP